jgi:hypothetical protein
VDTLAEFNHSDWNFVVYSGEDRVFESRQSDLRALVRFLQDRTDDARPVTFFDRYVGRAAALLMVIAEPTRVYAGIVSAGGRKVLEQHGIALEAGQDVDYLMGVASENMCRWEKLAVDKSPGELLTELERIYSNSDTN